MVKTPRYAEGGASGYCARERGYTIIEFMIAAAIMTAVLGGTVLIANQVQQAYTTDLDDVLVEQEVRFAIDWITRVLRSAGSNPYDMDTSACPSAGTTFQAVRLDPNANGEDDDIRVQADLIGSADGGPDGVLGGAAASCTQQGEDVTIALDSATDTITIRDNNTDASARTMTEPVISALEFTYLDSAGAVTTNPDLIVYVKVTITGQSKVNSLLSGVDKDTTLEALVRLRAR
jgi:pilin/secretion family protein with methylation motif